MAKLTLLALTIATLLALASAHRTIVTTTIEDDDTFDTATNPSPKREFCMQHLQSQRLRQCQTYLQQPDQITPFEHQQQTLQQCCQELQNVDQQCHCKAIKQVFGEVQQQQQQQQGPFGSQQIQQQLKQKAESLQNQCNLQTSKQCRIKTGKQCQQQIQGREFDRCQRYVEEQTGSGYLRSVVSNRPDREECCQELRSVEVECQCKAIKEVFYQAQQKQGQQQMPQIERVVEDLKNQCNLDVQECRIRSGMF